MAAKKGVVIEKGPGWAIIMLPDGEYQRIKPNRHLEVGEMYQEANLSPLKYITAAVILLALLVGTVDYYSVKAYAQVSSLAELGVNRWGRVVSVKAKNDQGQRILTTVEVKNNTLEAAIEKIQAQALKDKHSHKVSPGKPVLSNENIKADQSRLEEKKLKKMDQGVQKAGQSQKHIDNLKDTIKNNKQQNDRQQENIPINENLEIPSPNAKQGNAREVLKEDIKEEIKEEIKNLDEQVESLDPLIKKYDEQIELDKELNANKIQSDLENEIAKEKDELLQKYIHENKQNDRF